MDNQHSIPFVDLKSQADLIKPEVMEAVENILQKGVFSGGQYTNDFEKKFAPYCQSDYSIACNNGTSALHLALLALNIGQGDEVLVPANTFIATALAVSHCGATPVFVDCTSDTWQINPQNIEEKITPKTKAIIGVHLYGLPFDIIAIQEVAKKHQLFLIEDAAQAHGAKYKGQRVGSFGELACFSFYPTKNLGTYGEGGAITTSIQQYYTHIKSLLNQGMSEKYQHDMIGYNMRIGEIESAVLTIKLAYLEQWNKRRQEIAKIYRNQLGSQFQLQLQAKNCESVYHLFVITTQNRDALIHYLNQHQIYPGIHYPTPCHLQKAYAYLGYKKGDFPNTEFLAEHCLSLPMYPELKDEQVIRVIDVINHFN